MTIHIFGNHTEPGGDFNYEKREEYERSLKNNWHAVAHFSFNCIDGAEILISTKDLMTWTLQEIYARANQAVEAANEECNWVNFWVPGMTKK